MPTITKLSGLAVAVAAVLFVHPLGADVPTSRSGRGTIAQFSDWSEPVWLGPVVNTDDAEFGGSLSRDGLSLYFHSDRPGGSGGTDIWVTRRASLDDPWEPAENLGPGVNTENNESVPRVSLDGHRLFFASNRPGGFGGSDVYASRRRGRDDDTAWGPAENVGDGVNGPFNESAPAPFEDESDVLTLYFASNRPGGLGGTDIYASSLEPDETFRPAELVEEVSSPAVDLVPSIRRDGLEMFITSNRPGSLPFPPPFVGRSHDIWVATRGSTSEPWSPPVNLGSSLNTEFNDGWTALSFDGMTLYFSAIQPVGNGLDLYVSERPRLIGRVRAR